MMFAPWKLIGYIVLGLLGVAGVFAWNRHKDAQLEAATAAWKIRKASDDSILGVRTQESYQAGLANAQSIPVYLEGKAKIVHDAAGTPAESTVKACFDLADVRISKCEASRKADSATIAALRTDLHTAENKPEPQLPRFQVYGAAGYSVRVDSAGTQMGPAFRAGLDSKLIGPIRILTDGQLSLPGKGHASPMWQANLMARVTF